MDNITQKVFEADQKRLESQYGQVIEEVSKSFESRYGDNLAFSGFDSVALGKQLETWDKMKEVFEADAFTSANMGDYLRSGLGLVASTYATLPIQLLASVQPIEDEAGIVYMRRAVASNTRGGVTAGSVLLSEFGELNAGLASFVTDEVVDDSHLLTATAGTINADYNFTLTGPIKKGSLKIQIGTTINTLDDSEGHILGVNINPTSTVDYITGAVVLKLASVAGLVEGAKITITYVQDLVATDAVPSSKWDLVPALIQANYYLLQSSYSSIASFQIKQRFGTVLADDITRDTVAQINGSVLFNAVKKLRAAAIKNEASFSGTTLSFNDVAPAGVSLSDHRRSFFDTTEDSISRMETMTGKGNVSFLIVGAKGRKILSAVGFKAQNRNITGVYLMGFLDGVPVFSAPKSVLPDDEILVGNRGTSWFESPLVYSPFLPVTLTQSQGTINSFTNSVGVAHGAGLAVTVPGFIQRIKVTNV